jgi:hypothetical protein
VAHPFAAFAKDGEAHRFFRSSVSEMFAVLRAFHVSVVKILASPFCAGGSLLMIRIFSFNNGSIELS